MSPTFKVSASWAFIELQKKKAIINRGSILKYFIEVYLEFNKLQKKYKIKNG
ncbi:hypothetical protein GCM10011532_26610 [Christiangramia forsetii]|uniref:Uncharacterized protein n=1 Tax=Christiangramia forsetii TaxID=411153 RepID=A0ABQ1WQS0_9FLAO|nr:hypothetical protein GCM10011532_26610 [Christiangramia forsetii]